MASASAMALARTAVLRAASRQPQPVALSHQLRYVSTRSAATATPLRTALRQQVPRFRPRQQQSRRSASTAAPSDPTASIWKRMWDSPVGFKTVHFWAPIMKWAIVLAGIADFARPVEKLSFTQNLALTATGLIWTRWCLIIKPKNYLLAAVNFFLGMVGIVQITRIGIYEMTTRKSTTEKAAEAAKEPVAAVKEAIKQ